MVPFNQEEANALTLAEKVGENQLDKVNSRCPKEKYGVALTYMAKSQVHISMKYKSLDGNLNGESFKSKACSKPFSNASGLTRH